MKDFAQSGGESNPKYRIGPLSEEANGQRWVTLVSCGTVLEADMVRSQLEAAGIGTFLPDEQLMTAAAWGLNAYGYVRVQVEPADYEAARELLCAAGDAMASIKE